MKSVLDGVDDPNIPGACVAQHMRHVLDWIPASRSWPVFQLVIRPTAAGEMRRGSSRPFRMRTT